MVTGPAEAPPPPASRCRGRDRAARCSPRAEAALPADVAVFAAAVADWRVAGAAASKIKKDAGAAPPALELVAEPRHPRDARRSRASAGRALVVGFAAETDDLVANARPSARARAPTGSSPTTCRPATGIMGGEENAVHLITADGVEDWPRLAKHEVARRLAARIAVALA